MLTNRAVRFVLVLILLAFALPGQQGWAAEPRAMKPILLLYQDQAHEREIAKLALLLGHFGKVESKAAAELDEAEPVHEYEAVVAWMDRYDPDVLTEVRGFAEDGGLRLLLAGNVWDGPAVRIVEVEFEGETFAVDGSVIAWQAGGSDAAPELLAKGSTKAEAIPFAVREAKVWSFGGTLDGEMDKLLAAVLERMLEPVKHAETMMLVTGIGPSTDEEELAAVVEEFEQRSVPYALAVSPVDWQKGETLADSPRLTRLLSQAAIGAGSIVLTGAGDRDKTMQALAVLASLRLVPSAVLDGSSGEASDGESVGLFSTVIGAVPISEETRPTYYALPVRVSSDPGGRIRIPQVGVTYDSADPLADLMLMDAARSLRMLESPFLTVALQPAETAEGIRQALAAVAGLGYDYYDLGGDSNAVRTSFLEIQGGTLNITDEALLQELASQPKADRSLDRLSFMASWGIAVLVISFLFIFVLFILFMRRQRKVRLFGEEAVHG